MSERVRISIEKIMECERFRREVNTYDLNNIDFTEGGKVIDIPQKYRDDYRFTGLNNWHFIVTGFYQTGPASPPADNPLLRHAAEEGDTKEMALERLKAMEQMEQMSKAATAGSNGE